MSNVAVMPFRHVVMFKFNEGLGAEHVARVKEGLDSLPPQIEQIRRYVHGPDVRVSEGNWDYVLVADFDNMDDWITYRDHPTHQLFIAEHIAGNLADKASVQYET